MKPLYLLPLFFAWVFSPALFAAEVTKISASSAQRGNNPAHAVDGSQGTRWSSEGKGQWLLLELDEPFSFSEFEAGFSRGNRRYSFSVETSPDGKKWSQVFSGKSHGQGDSIKKFPASNASGRFIRFVSQGNNENNWVNLHTFRTKGLSVSKKLVKASPPVIKDPSGLEVSVWAENPLVASPVAISFDGKGRAYVTRVRRRKISSLDLRNHRAWVKHDLSIRSLEDKLAFYQKAMGPNVFPDVRHYSPPSLPRQQLSAFG